MKPLPDCAKCQKSPYVHALLGSKLACEWSGRKVLKEGDFGRGTILVVAEIYRMTGRKTPTSVVDGIYALKKEGIETW